MFSNKKMWGFFVVIFLVFGITNGVHANEDTPIVPEYPFTETVERPLEIPEHILQPWSILADDIGELSEPSSDTILTPKIVGGSVVNPVNKYSFMGSYQYYGYHWCGATLIAPDWAMTAAHCWVDPNGNPYDVTLNDTVLFGEFDISADNNGHEQRIQVESVYIHPEFENNYLNYDVALMKLASSAVLNDYVQPIDLVNSYEELNAGQDSVITGWGDTAWEGDSSDLLLYADIDILADSACWKYGGGSFNADTMICAGVIGGGTDSCQGDSGGPLFLDESGTYTQVGIVSWGNQCALPDFPGVYTRLTTMKPWIMAVLGETMVTPTMRLATRGLYMNRIDIRWYPVDGATGYKVFRSEINDINTSTVIKNVEGSSTALYNDYATSPGTFYYYWIKAKSPDYLPLTDFSNKKWGFVAKDTGGGYDPATSTFYLVYQNVYSNPNLVFQIGQAGSVPISGDWNGDGVDTIGLYNPTYGTFKLTDQTNPTSFDLQFKFGNPNWIPIAGDWNGDGIDTIGVYDPTYSVFRLRNSNSAGTEDIKFKFGNPGMTPIAGDWDGDGTDTIGTYDDFSVFRLRNSNSVGTPDITTKFGNPGEIPVTGDWAVSGFDTIGTYNADQSRYYLNFDNTTDTFELAYPVKDPSLTPLVGNWHNK